MIFLYLTYKKIILGVLLMKGKNSKTSNDQRGGNKNFNSQNPNKNNKEYKSKIDNRSEQLNPNNKSKK